MRCFAVMAWFMNVPHEVTYANDSTSPTVVSPPPFFSPGVRGHSLSSFFPFLTARWITCAQRQWHLGATTLIGEGVL